MSDEVATPFSWITDLERLAQPLTERHVSDPPATPSGAKLRAYVLRLERAEADLAQCRALLAALVAATMDEASAYLAAHPAPEGGQADG